jgi:CHAT domain-containing protein
MAPDAAEFEAARKRLEEVRRSTDVAELLEAFLNLGDLHLADQDPSSAFQQYASAADLVARTGNPRQAAELLLSRLADSDAGEIADGITRRMAGYARLSSSPNDAVHLLLAASHRLEGPNIDWRSLIEALELRSEALPLARITKDHGLIALLYCYLAKGLGSVGLHDAELEYCERARPHLKMAGGDFGAPARALWHCRMAEGLHATGRDGARPHARASLRMYEQLEDAGNAAIMRHRLAVLSAPPSPPRTVGRQQTLASLLGEARVRAAVDDFANAATLLEQAVEHVEDDAGWSAWVSVFDASLSFRCDDAAPWATAGRAARALADATAGLDARVIVAQAAARAFDAAGAYEETLDVYEWILDEVLPSSDLDVADVRTSVLTSIGSVLESLGRTREAESRYRTALATARSPHVLVRAHHGIGSVCEDTGRLEEAERSYRAAVDAATDPAYESELGDVTEIGNTHHNLGNVLADMDRPVEALKEYSAAESWAREHGDWTGIATALTSRATVLSDLGRADESATAFREAHELAVAVGARPAAAATLTALASGTSEDDLRLLTEARDRWRALRRTNEEGRSERRLASALRRIEEPEKAAERAMRALDLARLSSDLAGESLATLELYEQAVRRDSPETVTLIAEALRLARRCDDPGTRLTVLDRAGHHMLRLGRHDEAAALFEEAIELAELARSYRATPAGRAVAAESHRAVMRGLVSALIAAADATGGAASNLLRERALEAAIAARGRELFERHATRAAKPQRGTATLDALWVERAAVRAARQALFDLRTVAAHEQDPVRARHRAAAARQELVDAQRRHDALLAEAIATNPTYGVAQQVSCTVGDVRRGLLDVDSALVLYLFGVRDLHVFVVTDRAVQSITYRISAGLRDRVFAVRHDLRHQSAEVEAWTAHLLYRELLEPAEALCGGALPRRLVLSLDGYLNLLPFGALVCELDGQRAAAFVAERHEIRICPSPAATVANRASARPAVPDGELIVFGDPIAQGWGRISRTAAEASGIAALRRTDAPTPPALDSLDPEPMAYISADGGVQLRTGQRATKSELLKLLHSRRFSCVHLAMHGRADFTPGHRSGIVLSDDGDGEPGFLTASEIEEEMINCDLCVLSACETGLGELTTAEGVIGLARSFTLAGVREVCMSFWKVDDRSTALLMLDLHAGLVEGLDAAQALHRAQLKSRESGDPPGAWTSFALVV